MRIRTFLLYLIGNRQAILELAADRRALWVGLAFVISAGFAREYDGEDLLRKPWYVFIPLLASLAGGSLLFLVACTPALPRMGRPAFLSAYRSFLTLFWMTAPLAWMYAIPYARFLSPGEATSANLLTLALVAAWRVALMARVISVITDRGWLASFCLVMIFASGVALAAATVVPPVQIVSLMGGSDVPPVTERERDVNRGIDPSRDPSPTGETHLTESERIVRETASAVRLFGYCSAPIWLICGLVAFFTGRAVWKVPSAPAEPMSSGRGIWILVACSVLVWLPLMTYTQAEQQLRTRVERDLKAGRIAEALDVMSEHQRSDFPPAWEPPPRMGFVEEAPTIIDVMDVLVAREVAPWVRAEYVDKLRRSLGSHFDGRPMAVVSDPRVLNILQQIPEGSEIAAEHSQGLKDRLSGMELSAEGRANLEALLKLAGKAAHRPGE